MRTAAIVINLLLPGLGHIMLHRRVRGFSILVGYGVFADLLAIAIAASPWNLGGGAWIFLALAASGTLGFWVYGLVDVTRIYVPATEGAREERDAHLRCGLIAYIRNDLKTAREEFERVLAIEPRDLEARLQLCVIDRREGRLGEAKKSLLALRRMDRAQKLRWEILRELAALEGEPQRSGAAGPEAQRTPGDRSPR